MKRRIGYVPESAALYESLTAREYLELDRVALPPAGRRHALRASRRCWRASSLAHAIDQRLSEFSKGMKQKVLIASALMHRPEVLFLDEPLTGLDANAALVVKELMRGSRRRAGRSSSARTCSRSSSASARASSSSTRDG